MPNIDDILRGLENEEEPEDKIIHVRERPGGELVEEYEIREQTRFAGGYPQTTKTFITKQPLACGHHVSRENSFAGYCSAHRSFLSRRVCGAEFCASCAVQCAHCGKWVSVHCHAKVDEDSEQMYCRHCARDKTLKRVLKVLWLLLSRPFIAKGGEDVREEERDLRVTGPESESDRAIESRREDRKRAERERSEHAHPDRE